MGARGAQSLRTHNFLGAYAVTQVPYKSSVSDYPSGTSCHLPSQGEASWGGGCFCPRDYPSGGAEPALPFQGEARRRRLRSSLRLFQNSELKSSLRPVACNGTE